MVIKATDSRESLEMKARLIPFDPVTDTWGHSTFCSAKITKALWFLRFLHRTFQTCPASVSSTMTSVFHRFPICVFFGESFLCSSRMAITDRASWTPPRARGFSWEKPTRHWCLAYLEKTLTWSCYISLVKHGGKMNISLLPSEKVWHKATISVILLQSTVCIIFPWSQTVQSGLTTGLHESQWMCLGSLCETDPN